MSRSASVNRGALHIKLGERRPGAMHIKLGEGQPGAMHIKIGKHGLRAMDIKLRLGRPRLASVDRERWISSLASGHLGWRASTASDGHHA